MNKKKINFKFILDSLTLNRFPNKHKFNKDQAILKKTTFV